MLLRSVLGMAVATLATASRSTVNIWLRSSWDAPPLLLEVLESAALEDPTVYYPMLSLLTSHLPLYEGVTPKKQLETIYDLIQSSSIAADHPKWDFTSFKTSLAMHESTPKIQAFYQYYDTVTNETDIGNGIGNLCDSWVEWRGKGFCDVEELKRDMELTLTGNTTSERQPIPKLLPFDHIYPQTYMSSPHPPAIIYLSDLTSSQADLYEYLMGHAKSDDSFEVIVRYRPVAARIEEVTDINRRRNSLKGYGVEMVLKKTDYLAVDDRDTGTAEVGQTQEVFEAPRSTNLSSEDGYSSIIGEGSWDELIEKPLKLGEIADLGLKTASLIMADPNPLQALIGVSQDFPKHSAAIARNVELDHQLVEAVSSTQQRNRLLNRIWVNGRALLDNELNAFSLLSILREERHRMVSLTSLGLTPDQAFQLLTDEDIATGLTEVDPMEGLVDASDLKEGGEVITWWNNIEKDKRYAGWTNSVAALTRAGRQGPLSQQVRRNFWHLVLVLDMSKSSSMSTISGMVQQMVKRGMPFRVGLVPLISDQDNDESTKMARFFSYIIATRGRARSMEFMQILMRHSPNPSMDPAIVENLYTAHFYAVDDDQDSRPASFSDIVNGKVEALPVERTRAWLERLSLSPRLTPGGAFFLNGHFNAMDERWTDRLMQVFMAQQSYLGQAGMVAQLKTARQLDRFFYDLPTTSSRRNLYLISEDVTSQDIVHLPDIFGSQSVLVEQFVYPQQREGKDILTTINIVGDLDSDEGRNLCRNVLEHLRTEQSLARVGFIHTPSHKSSYHHPLRFSTFLHEAYSSKSLSSLSPSSVLQILDEIEASDVASVIKLGEFQTETADSDRSLNAPLPSIAAYVSPLLLASSRSFWDARAEEAGAMPILLGSFYIIANGRLIGPVTSERFLPEDFGTLERIDAGNRGLPVANALKRMYDDHSVLEQSTLASMVTGIASVIGRAYSAQTLGPLQTATVARTRLYEGIANQRSSFSIGLSNTSLLRIFAVIDPVSEQAQKWSSLIETALGLAHTSATIQLNPSLALAEIPVKRFYRYESINEMRFSSDGSESLTGAQFRSLPEEPILTLGLDIPTSWLVRPKDSVHDLDNLRLETILARQEHSVVDLRFELEQLVIEGHASEPGQPVPRGLQLQLTDPKQQVIGDTSVMANVGYFQFKSSPGLFQLAIRSGRGQDVYDLNSIEAKTPGLSYKEDMDIALTSFSGLTIMPVFKRKGGMEGVDVLQEMPVVSGFMDRIYSSISTVLGRSPAPVRKNADINIFTVASGKLYERFASIMVLSVLKHTESTVKFWFIENFLSPSFLEFLPHFAAEYGFQYELVTYKWPSWLRGQKEKQREIWGYKILFLDVLFPLDLDKVIFVDADQIVRTDLQELVNLNLQNRVYGYAPMGDDKPEMEGYRFWKTGYWKDALRGKPYHISALYVIDLKKFRQIAAGDRLRAQYQALSADPNSLSNLDQDLPNSMQDQLPIFTLDKSWLWCETWCSQESLKDAKTIDLCQNPLTKQPKLERAKSIPEWDSYDQEVEIFAKRLSQKGSAYSEAPLENQDIIDDNSGETGHPILDDL